ncbi:MAG: thiazole synthase, partial [Pseudomonadota bacterium]
MAASASTLKDPIHDPLVIAGKAYRSRLLVGTGKYKDLDETRRAVEASGAEIVTVAIRRTNLGQNPNEPNLLDVLPASKYTYLPNTAGCYSTDDAVRTCRLARELLDGHDLVKLEVLGDPKTLYPDIPQTLAAAEILIKDGFKVMVYTNDDPIVARRLEEMGCVAVMPLAAPLGSGLGIRNP